MLSYLESLPVEVEGICMFKKAGPTRKGSSGERGGESGTYRPYAHAAAFPYCRFPPVYPSVGAGGIPYLIGRGYRSQALLARQMGG